MEGVTSKVLLQTPQKSVGSPTDSSWLLGHSKQEAQPARPLEKNTVIGRFFSFYCIDVSVSNVHTQKGLFVAHTQRYPLTIRNKHNPIAQLNTQLNLMLERDGPVVCLQC